MTTSKRRNSEQSIKYLNVDLEIRARAGLDLLADELARRMFPMYRGKVGSFEHASFETLSMTKTPDATIRALVRVLRKLSPAAKRAWRAGVQKDFNIGIEAGRNAKRLELALETTTVREVAQLGGRIIITVYPAPAPARAARQSRKRGS